MSQSKPNAGTDASLQAEFDAVIAGLQVESEMSKAFDAAVDEVITDSVRGARMKHALMPRVDAPAHSN